jgi:hypothetical protein
MKIKCRVNWLVGDKELKKNEMRQAGWSLRLLELNDHQSILLLCIDSQQVIDRPAGQGKNTCHVITRIVWYYCGTLTVTQNMCQFLQVSKVAWMLRGFVLLFLKNKKCTMCLCLAVIPASTLRALIHALAGVARIKLFRHLNMIREF